MVFIGIVCARKYISSSNPQYNVVANLTQQFLWFNYRGASQYIIYILIYCLLFVLFIVQFLYWWSPVIPSRNLDEVFTYNHMALITLRIRSHVKEYIVLTRVDHLCKNNNYIRLFLNIILRPLLMVRTRLDHVP